MKARPGRWIEMGRALDAKDDAPFLVAVTTPDLRLDGSCLVGPFAASAGAEAWRAVQRSFRGSGAFFVVLVRGVRGAPAIGPARAAAKELLSSMPYYTSGQRVELDAWYVAALAADRALVLDGSGRLPRYRDERTALRAVEKSAARPAIALRAVLGEHWHANM